MCTFNTQKIMESDEKALARTRVRQKRTVNCKNGWTETDDQLLTRLVLKDSRNPNWPEISQHFPGKTMQQISERWNKVVDPSLVKGSWTRKEDELIISFVNQNGTKKWTKLASMLPGRIGKQCRERWKNHLDPANAKTSWTEEEDMQLIELHKMYGNHWAKIASYMIGRSDNSIKNRWNSTLSRCVQKNGSLLHSRMNVSKNPIKIAAMASKPIIRQNLPLPISAIPKPVQPAATSAPADGNAFNWVTDDLEVLPSGTSPSAASIFTQNDSETPFSIFSPNQQGLYDQFL